MQKRQKKDFSIEENFLAYATALGATTATAYGLLGLAAPNKVEASDVKKRWHFKNFNEC